MTGDDLLCPTHHVALQLEDSDFDFALYVCPVETCRHDRREGGSRDPFGPQHHTGVPVRRPAAAGDVWRR